MMSVVEVGLRNIESDNEADKHITVHKFIQGMYIVFSQQSRLGMADISVKDDPDKNTHAIYYVIMVSIPLIGYRM